MARKTSIATTDEILKHFTSIMRGESDADVKINESLSAGEKLYKMLRDKQSAGKDERLCGVVILPEVHGPGEEDAQ